MEYWRNLFKDAYVMLIEWETLQKDLLHSIQEGNVDHEIEQLTDVEYVRHQLGADVSHFSSRFAEVSTGLCGVLADFSLVKLYPLAIEDPQSVQMIMELADQANGFALSGLAGRNPYESAPVQVARGSRTDVWAGRSSH